MKRRRGSRCSELERDRQRKTEKEEELEKEQAGNRTQVEEMDRMKIYRVRDKINSTGLMDTYQTETLSIKPVFIKLSNLLVSIFINYITAS